jgi:hypothetical protein
MMKQEIEVWLNFHTYWREKQAYNYPVYFFRYEDIISDPVKTLTGLFKFLLDVPSLEGTVVEEKIKQYVSIETKP